MKCVVGDCTNSIDELKAFPAVEVGGKLMADEIGQRLHAADLEKWEHVTVQASRGGGSVQVMDGHVCPEHRLITGQVTIGKAGK